MTGNDTSESSVLRDRFRQEIDRAVKQARPGDDILLVPMSGVHLLSEVEFPTGYIIQFSESQLIVDTASSMAGDQDTSEPLKTKIFSLSKEHRNWLKKQAKREDTSEAGIVRRLIDRAIEEEGKKESRIRSQL